MLLNDFFYIKELSTEGFVIKAELLINQNHAIFDGHFPGQPVVPGVCMMQMVKEIIESVTGKRTNLSSAHEMKFLAVIDPVKNNIINAVLKYTPADDHVQAVAALMKDELIHFKFKGQFDFQ